MEKNSQIVKRGNESLEKIDKRPTLLVNDIAKLVNASTLIKPQYRSVRIGDQIWMTENLNGDHYRNGDPIPEVKEREEWSNLKTGAWCNYDNDSENGGKYGKLYNWYAVNDPRGFVPKGWHIPTKVEIETLATVVSYDGNALKAVGQGIIKGIGTNTSGFSALLAGYRNYVGYFSNLGLATYFWSSTVYGVAIMYGIYLYDDDSHVGFYDYNMKYGFSVRCLKD